MSPGPVDRRSFLAGGTGAFVCTLAGQRIAADGPPPDLEALVAGIEVPPKVRAAAAAGGPGPRATTSAAADAPARREYWISAETVRWTVVPRRRDEMMDRPVAGRSTFTAFAYRAYAPGFARPLGPAAMPGPLLEAQVGDTLIVNFRNRLKVPVTMHPHGLFYPPAMDGAYKGRFTDPGGFVLPGRTFRYVWDCREGTEGVWPYHDHGPLDPLPLYRGLFGFVHVRASGAPRPDVDHYLALHTLLPATTGLDRTFHCVNGRSYAGNTPSLLVRAGQRVAQHVAVLDGDFHTYHLHGHRWRAGDDRLVDSATVGPAEVLSLAFTEDNPGRWLYHCHVFRHLHEGMSGWYLVER